jgi:hypothetical protein
MGAKVKFEPQTKANTTDSLGIQVYSMPVVTLDQQRMALYTGPLGRTVQS